MTEADIIVMTEPQTAAANKANALASQADTIAAASAGSSVFCSAADYLAANPVIKGYQK